MQVALRMDRNYIKNNRFPVELAFVDVQEFLDTKNYLYVDRIKEIGVDVVSIHAPHFKILDPDIKRIWYKLIHLAKQLKVEHIVFHPSYGNFFDNAVAQNLSFINNLTKRFTIVCVEKFGSKRRIISSYENFLRLRSFFDNLYCCYDFSHVIGNEYTVEAYLPFTKSLHVSNRKGENTQHQRLFDKTCDLDYNLIIQNLKRNCWDGILVLEYMKEFHEYLVEDAQRLEELIYE